MRAGGGFEAAPLYRHAAHPPGYFGGIVLLLGVYLGFIAGDGPFRRRS